MFTLVAERPQLGSDFGAGDIASLVITTGLSIFEQTEARRRADQAAKLARQQLEASIALQQQQLAAQVQAQKDAQAAANAAAVVAARPPQYPTAYPAPVAAAEGMPMWAWGLIGAAGAGIIALLAMRR